MLGTLRFGPCIHRALELKKEAFHLKVSCGGDNAVKNREKIKEATIWLFISNSWPHKHLSTFFV
jgi:hypothetical protein